VTGDELKYEMSYWGNCCNTFDEEQKQYVYARFMGLEVNHYKIQLPASDIMDVGGGPASMLLKVPNLIHGLVVDPIEYPDWTVQRYATNNITVRKAYGENILIDRNWDEVWLYNCLQHVNDPEKIVKNCMRSGKVFRIFEWINTPVYEGHPHSLTKEMLDRWIGQSGGTVLLNESGCDGWAYYGCFKTGN
jgi:hypothetical protein